MADIQRSELSDEDQDIDIESDDDDTNSSNGGPYEGADKKAHHNALERKRRDHIKESFIGLRDCLPMSKREKPSRAQILKHATDYIQFMMNKTNTAKSEIESMKKQNQLLEQQVKIVERKRKHEAITGSSTQSSYYNDGEAVDQSESSDNSDHDVETKSYVPETKAGKKRSKQISK